ncbi:response regulator [Metasolibacillus meyeri]|uniref:Response regulator n=1 Tax=Metasolibacillus meyeri TaxID=1071052 RepID=A0AAW9NKZ2_9BACL|nr:response regulator [Metasolibacillus meyeri]MEC1178012.1 response regulator [Metasolibacillus meyeri]
MNIIIIDDEQMAIDVLQIMLKKVETVPITIKGAFTNVGDVLPLFEQERIDVVLLDIEMVDMHGLQVAKQLIAKQPLLQIIFVTAHMQFAVDAFEIEATDYLLKPVHEKRLLKALTKAKNKWEVTNYTEIQDEKQIFYTHTFGSFQLLDYNNQTVKWRTKKVKELFIYLWLQRQKPILNVVIIELLWPNIDPEKGSANLYTTIYQIRKLFKDKGVENAIELVNNHYQLNIELKSDYEDLQKLLNEENPSESNIQQILNLYEGDFLEKEEYDWAISIRNEVKQQVLHILEHYVRQEGSANTLLKLSCLQKLLLLDEYNERYMLMLLRFLVENNRKTECIQLYKEIKNKLEDDLKIPIPQDIKKEYEKIVHWRE